MTRDLICTLCKKPVVEHPVSFVNKGKLWTVNILLCKDEKCLLTRGGISRDHRTEKRGQPLDKKNYSCRFGCVIDEAKPCGIRHNVDCQTNHHNPELTTFMVKSKETV